jgi:hypothetical protein
MLNSIFGLPPKPKVLAQNTYFAFLSIDSRFLDVINYGLALNGDLGVVLSVAQVPILET